MRVTIIGVGNTARGDDGVGHRVLDRLEDALSDDDSRVVTLVRAHQLDFGMASDLADSDIVVFVDAERRAAPLTELTALSAGPGAASLHGVDAAGLLGLVRSLYDSEPPSWLLSVAGPSMGHGEALSDTAEAASVEAASVIIALLAEHGGRLGTA
jgi:hydrogenase maturation protease